MFKIQSPEDKLSQTLYKTTTTQETYPYLTISKFTPNTTINNFSKTRYFETTENRLNQKPPIYYIRKVQKPYKYNITSVPQGYSNKITTEEMFNNRIKNYIKKDFENVAIENVISSSSNDKYKPNGYVFRDFLIKNPKYLKPNILSSNPEKKLKKMLTYNEIKKNANQTQIQFDTEDNIKNKTIEQQFYNTDYPKVNKRQEELFKHKGSDIFNLRQDGFFNNKSGEKYLFKTINNTENNKEKVYMTNGSNSNWAPKIPKKLNHIGYSSVNFNILVPNIKSISKTKNDIENNDKCNNKVKSLSEFIDLCRVSATNKSENYEKLLNQDKSCFRKRNNIGANFLDMHNSYRECIPHPFS